MQVDRGHQRYRVIEVDARNGALRNLIDEKSATFIWTAHTENLNLSYVNWLEKTDEMIYVSERDGWRHLYLVDTQAGKIRNQITEGQFVVRGIDRIDEENRQVWVRARGKNPDQDPYFVHYYRVNFDGTGMVVLTEANGNHTLQFSPDRKFIIDTCSRVDLAPVHQLRRVSDFGLVCQFEKADISELKAGAWQPPEVFVAKGRDGKTDIWGIICRPHNLDPAKKYPVIEQVYAGPQGSFVPKSFSALDRFSSLTDLGFIVVQIDGMGTGRRPSMMFAGKISRTPGSPTVSCGTKPPPPNIPITTLLALGLTATPPEARTLPGPCCSIRSFTKPPWPTAAVMTIGWTRPPGTSNGWAIPSARNTRSVPTSRMPANSKAI